MVKPISNVEVFGLESSIVGSGYPMRVTNSTFNHDVDILRRELIDEDNFLEVWYDWKQNKTKIEDKNLNFAIKSFNRMCNLGNSPGDSGHPQALSGITVNFDLSFTNKAWVEAERYRYLFFVSSQSLQHRATKFDLSSPDAFDSHVDKRIIDVVREKVNEHNVLLAMSKETSDIETIKEIDKRLKELHLEIIMSMPNGFVITARMTTNYRELRQIYYQRQNHKLPEWREFCAQVRELPYFKQICLGE